MSTSETRVRPRRAGNTTAAKKATASRKNATGSKKDPARLPAKSPARAMPAASKRTPKAASKTTSRAAPKKAPAKTPRKRVKPDLGQDVYARLHGAVTTALEDLKARDTREIDVRGKTSVTDLIVVTSGTSTRHVKSIADEVVRSAKKIGLPPIGVEGQREAEWVLVDLGDIVVHVMLPRTREFYGLERLWTVGDEDHPEMLAG
ncbi:ribosome silencing factor RsfS/YbeB/iojap [Dokdonella immobilis]|uniref:Ribosomal silencing factor RsfS n=1 Tax=Dokdonella immobilis TaxID=578942 RepID=A0A1I4WK58_9GAMM|nr:ribosome silencing factor RsfS/YbeB/iojap [Dokdonella immobilis]